MADELKVTVWRFTLPELYLANCPGLRDPGARNGHYHSAKYRTDEEGAIGLYESALKMAVKHPDHRYFDAQAWEGPDADHRMIYHLKALTKESYDPVITMLRRSVRVSGGTSESWRPISQLEWPNYLHIESQEA